MFSSESMADAMPSSGPIADAWALVRGRKSWVLRGTMQSCAEDREGSSTTGLDGSVRVPS